MLKKKEDKQKKSCLNKIINNPTIENMEEANNRVDFLDTGCVTLNLASSQKGKDGGWARGRVVNLVGDNSSGKCVKNCYVITEKGIQKIDDMLNEDGYFNFKTKIASFKNEIKETSHIYKELADETIRIKTKYGFEIEGTPEHPIMLWCPTTFTFELKPLDEVKEGDIIVIQKGMCMFPEYPYRFKLNSEYQKNISGFNAIQWELPKTMNESLATLLGYFVADGIFTNNAITISNSKNYNKENILNCLSALDIHINSVERGINISRTEFRNFVFNLFGKPEDFTARFKFVPKCILQSTKQHQVSFLKALIDCDSWCDTNKHNLEYYTASKELAKQVQLMLLNFGIFFIIIRKIQ